MAWLRADDVEGLVFQFALAPGERHTVTTYDGHSFIALLGMPGGPLSSGVEVFRVSVRAALAGQVVVGHDCRLSATPRAALDQQAPRPVRSKRESPCKWANVYST